jgi:hypothetical protein
MCFVALENSNGDPIEEGVLSGHWVVYEHRHTDDEPRIIRFDSMGGRISVTPWEELRDDIRDQVFMSHWLWNPWHEWNGGKVCKCVLFMKII